MTAYDVQVENAAGTSGETVRVEAEDETTAAAAALERVPEGWTVARVSDATDHGEAWGVDLTTNIVPVGPTVVGEGPRPEPEPYVFPDPSPDYVEPDEVVE